MTMSHQIKKIHKNYLKRGRQKNITLSLPPRKMTGRGGLVYMNWQNKPKKSANLKIDQQRLCELKNRKKQI